jgi:tRNA(adenine34) deaminase
MLDSSPDEQFMRKALIQAERSLEEDEVPVGAVVVRGERIIGRGRNRREGLRDPTAHAEILAIGAAASSLGAWRLSGCTIYVTLEPCAMCAGAIVLARIERLVIGAADPKSGACGSLLNIVEDGRLNHTVSVTREILAAESGALLRSFFSRLRKADGNGGEPECGG